MHLRTLVRRVDFLVGEAFASILPAEAADRVVVAEGGAAGFLRTMHSILARYDVAVDLHGTVRTAAFALAAAPLCVGPDKRGRRFAYHLRLPPPPEARHAVLRNLDVLDALRLPRPETPPAPAVRVEAPPDPPPAPYVVLHVGARFPHKVWPLERFAQLARSRIEKGETVVLLEGPLDGGAVAEVEARPEVREEIGRRLRVARGLTPPETAGLLAGARAFVGNDSGPMHLAAAVGTPVVALFGPSDERIWGPWAPKERAVVLRRDCACPYGSRPPCVLSGTTRPRCLEEIPTAVVETALDRLLS